jgi:hypothetical protein
MLSVLEGLKLISAVSVANSAPGDLPSLQSSSAFKLKTDVVSNLAGKGFNGSFDSRVVDGTCLTAADMAKCCMMSGTCCVARQCDSARWQGGKFVDQDFTVLVPTGLKNLNAEAYDLIMGKINGNPFEKFDEIKPLIDVYFFNIRAAHSNIEIYDLTQGYGRAEVKPKAILRIPVSIEVAESLGSIDVTTPTQQGMVAGCLAWDEVAKKWSTGGLSQAPGAQAMRKLCLKKGTQSLVECSYFVECESTYLKYFTVALTPLDCQGTVLGKVIFDQCDVCAGDNTTCSGCDGTPNSVQDGMRLDRSCSGHGTCNGGFRCSCCSDNQYKIATGGSTGSAQLKLCPWFGIMCHRFCTRAEYQGADANSAIQKIHCSGHGTCVDPPQGGSVQCECDPGWFDGDKNLCGRPVSTKYVVTFAGMSFV